MSYHTPVLLNESINMLVTNPDGVYVDCTFGGGGHSKLILEKLSDKGRLIAFDQDADANDNAIEDARFTLVRQNFRYLDKQLKHMGITQVAGLLADLGISSHQIDMPERGFSTRYNAALDMRMNQSQELSAKDIVNEYSEQALIKVLKEYGEISNAKRAAKLIVDNRQESPIQTTNHLKEILQPLAHYNSHKYYAQIFQALRIEVNDEISALQELLIQTINPIAEDGRLVVISYHSLEDRLVKRFIKTGMFEGEPERDLYGNWYAPFHPIQNKVITPSKKEIENNKRARSAKMRIGIKNIWPRVAK